MRTLWTIYTKILIGVILAVLIGAGGVNYYTKTQSDAKYLAKADADTAAYLTATETIEAIDSVKGIITALPFTIPVSATAPTTGANAYIQTGSGKLWIKSNNSWKRPLFAADSTAIPSTLLDGLFGYWKLDEASGSVLNSVSGGVTGTNNGAVTNQVGKIGTAYSYDTNTDYINFVYGTPPTSQQRTISMWFKVNTLPSVAARQYRLYSDVHSSFNTKFMVRISTANTLYITVRNTATTEFYYLSAVGAISSTNTWYHVTFLLPDIGDNGAIYINGALSTSGTPTPVTGTHYADNYRFVLGDQGGTTNIDGFIDEFGYWDRWLTPTEIVANYNAGTGKTHPFTTW